MLVSVASSGLTWALSQIGAPCARQRALHDVTLMLSAIMLLLKVKRIVEGRSVGCFLSKACSLEK